MACKCLLGMWMNVKCLIPCWKKYPPLSLLAAAIPTILSADGIWVCERVQISKQLEPFAFLFCWSFPQLLDPTCSSSSSSLCLHLTKVAKLSKCKEVAWKEALVGQRASPILLLFAQLKKGKYGKNSRYKRFDFCRCVSPLNKEIICVLYCRSTTLPF